MATRLVGVQQHVRETHAVLAGVNHTFGAADVRREAEGGAPSATVVRHRVLERSDRPGFTDSASFWSDLRDGSPGSAKPKRGRHSIGDASAGARAPRNLSVAVSDSSFSSDATAGRFAVAGSLPQESPIGAEALRAMESQPRHTSADAGRATTKIRPTNLLESPGRSARSPSELLASQPRATNGAPRQRGGAEAGSDPDSGRGVDSARRLGRRGSIDRAAVDGSTSQLSAALEADEAEAVATKTKRCTCLIDPQNVWKLRWDLLIAIFIIFSVILVPLRLAFELEATGAWLGIDIFIDCCFAVDIIATFNTAYYSDGVLIANRRKIAREYMLGMFWVDFLSTVPFHHIGWIVQTILKDGSNTTVYLQGIRLLKALRLIRLLRLGRLLKLRRLAIILEEQIGFNTAVLTFGAVVFTVLFSIHIIACFWYYVGPGLDNTLELFYGLPEANTTRSHWLSVYIDNKFPDSPNEFDTISRQYIASVYWAAATAMSVGYGDIAATTDIERLYSILALLVGAGLFGYIITSVSTMIVTAAPRQAEMQRQMQEVAEYTREQSLPRELRRDIIAHFEHFLSWKSVYDETGILSNMSDPLAELVVRNRYREVIMRINMLNHGLDDVIPRSLRGEAQSARRRGGAAVAAALAAAEEGMRRQRTDVVHAQFGRPARTAADDTRAARVARRIFERVFTCALRPKANPLDHVGPSALPGGFMCALLPLMRPFRISSGSVVFGPNDSPGEMYFILEGIVEISLGNAGHIGDHHTAPLDKFGFRKDIPLGDDIAKDELPSAPKSKLAARWKQAACARCKPKPKVLPGKHAATSFEFPFLTTTGIVGGTTIRANAVWEGASDRGAIGFYKGDRCVFQFFVKLGALCQWYVRHETKDGASGFVESGPYAKEQLQEWLAMDVLPPTVLIARATSDRANESAWVPLGEAPLPLFACREASEDGIWGASVLGTGGKISSGAEIELEVTVKQGCFYVTLNGRRVAEFKSSDAIDLSDVTEIAWDFDFDPMSSTIYIPSIVVGVLTHGQHFGEEHVLWVEESVDVAGATSSVDGANEQRWDPWASALPGSFTYSAAVNCSILSVTASELQHAALVEFPEINQRMLNHARRRWWLLERTSRKVVAHTNSVTRTSSEAAHAASAQGEGGGAVSPAAKSVRKGSVFAKAAAAPPSPTRSEAFVAAAGAIPIMHNASVVSRGALRTARLWPQPRHEKTHHAKFVCIAQRASAPAESTAEGEAQVAIELKETTRRTKSATELSPSEQIELEFTVSDDDFAEVTKEKRMLAIPKFAGDAVRLEMTVWEVLRKKWLCLPRLPVKIAWDLFVGLLIVYSVVVVPFRISFNVVSEGIFFWLDTGIDVCFFIDIIASFRTPYLDNDTGGYVLMQCSIAFNYLKLWFWIDLVSTVPVDSLFLIAGVGGQEVLRSLRLIRVLRLARLLKLVRLVKLSKLAPSLSEITYELPPGAGKLLRLMFEALLVAHLLACFYFLSSYVFDKDKPTYEDSWWGADGTQIEEGDYWRQYLASMYVVACTRGVRAPARWRVFACA
jgi:hypothetical protein